MPIGVALVFCGFYNEPSSSCDWGKFELTLFNWAMYTFVPDAQLKLYSILVVLVVSLPQNWEISLAIGVHAMPLAFSSNWLCTSTLVRDYWEYIAEFEIVREAIIVGVLHALICFLLILYFNPQSAAYKALKDLSEGFDCNICNLSGPIRIFYDWGALIGDFQVLPR